MRAQEIVRSLAEDVEEELGHAWRFAHRIKELYGIVPGSREFRAEQSLTATDGVDHITQDMVIEILHDEQRHRRLFVGFLREYQSG